MQRYFSPSNRGFYSDDVHPRAADRPKDCVPVSDAQWQAALAENSQGKELSFEGDQIVARVKPVTMDNVRAKRDSLLRQTDWSQLVDIPSETQQRYAAYRQELRDVPEKFPTPEEVVWPEKPVEATVRSTP